MGVKNVVGFAAVLVGVSLLGWGAFGNSTIQGSGLVFEYDQPAVLKELIVGETHRLPLEIKNPTWQDVRIVGDSAC